MPDIDLRDLRGREGPSVEWKDQVADEDDVLATICAFANDYAELGGGYVVCGAREVTDADGFQTLEARGLDANRLRELKGKVLDGCANRIRPSFSPLVEELPADTPDRRVLVFIVARTSHAHTFRRRNDGEKHFVRADDRTIEARNGVLRDLYIRRGTVQPWAIRPCVGATDADIDKVTLRDGLERLGLWQNDPHLDTWLDPDRRLHALVDSLCVRTPLDRTVVPRNYAVLLFGRTDRIPALIPGAHSIFSSYPGVDRTDSNVQRQEIWGTLSDQIQRVLALLGTQSMTLIDKDDVDRPNVNGYPRRALLEAAVNAFAHREYESHEPVRVTVFADRIEIRSPGGLFWGVDPVAFARGDVRPKWRNQPLAWVLNRLQLAQGEGQGLPTIKRTMLDEAHPAPTFLAEADDVVCVLPAHPRQRLADEIAEARRAMLDGDLTYAAAIASGLLERDPLAPRFVQLFTDVKRAAGASESDIQGMLASVQLKRAEYALKSSRSAGIPLDIREILRGRVLELLDACIANFQAADAELSPSAGVRAAVAERMRDELRAQEGQP